MVSWCLNVKRLCLVSKIVPTIPHDIRFWSYSEYPPYTALPLPARSVLEYFKASFGYGLPQAFMPYDWALAGGPSQLRAPYTVASKLRH